jgi:hypothetical protein
MMIFTYRATCHLFLVQLLKRGDISKTTGLFFFLSDCTTEHFPSSVPPESISIQYSGSSMAEGGVITLEEGKLETVLCITRYSSLTTTLLLYFLRCFRGWRLYSVLPGIAIFQLLLLLYFLRCFRSWRPFSVLLGTALCQLLLLLYFLRCFRSWRPFSVLPGTALYQLLLLLYLLRRFSKVC